MRENTETTEHRSATKNKRQCNMHRNKLLDNNCHIPDLVTGHLKKMVG